MDGVPLEDSVYSLLCKPVRRLVEERGFTSLTDPQIEAIPRILEGRNVLLIAPTGTGKTEAAFFPILSKFIETPEKPQGIKILYITPLRALNRDLLERLEWWCGRLDVKVAVRHGDTEARERTYQSRSPPDMLITTPETLQAILPGRNMRRHLRSVRWVVVDEVHEFAVDKRGSQLSLALERLRQIVGTDFQIVGLSATIGSPERVAQFLVGTDRPVEIVRVPVARYMKFEILFPEPEPGDFELAARLYTHPEVAARLKVMRKLIEEHKAVLLFTNTRSIAEVLASRFKVWDIDFPVSIHHGSLAKPSRITAERGLKGGELKGLVCTSSLELGIDIGTIDLCIQYMSPRQVTRLVQRVGRSGHRIGRVAKGVILTMDSDDTLEAVVIARRAYLEDLEPVSIPEKPFDALTHQIVGLFIQERRWYFDQILKLFRRAYPYRDLSEEELTKVLQYMHDRYPRLAWVSFEDKLAMRPQDIKAVYQYYYENLSMIPDEKQYLVIDETNNTPVSVLDEAFVAEYGEPGTKFIVRGSAWKIVNVYGDKIYVKPVEDPTGAIPSWVGEEIPVPFEVALEVGRMRAFVVERINRGAKPEEVAAELAERYPADANTLLRAIRETVEQARKGLHVPTDRVVTVEEWEEYVIVHASFGTLVSRTLARLTGHLLSERTGYTIGVQQDPYRVIIQTQGEAGAKEVIETLHELSGMDIRSVAVDASTKTGLFKARMIHVARKFGAMSKYADFSNISLSQLTKSFQGTAVFDEAVKETFNKDLDIPNTEQVLSDIREGKISLVHLGETSEATPIAKVGIARIGMRSDLISPEKMRRIAIESARARLLNEARTLACTNCWRYVQMLRVKDLPERVRCPACGSDEVGVLSRDEEEVLNLSEKGGRPSTSKEQEVLDEALETARLVSQFGRVAVVVLAGRHLGVDEASEILSEEREMSDKLFDLIVEAERKALSKKFW